MENVRLHVEDTLYALLVCYLRTGSRDLSFFDFSIAPPGSRIVSLDGIDFKIVSVLPGQGHEVPGINLTFYDELPSPRRTSPQSFTRLATIHTYVDVQKNISLANRTVLKLQRLIDEALYGSGTTIYDFYGPVATPLQHNQLSWGLLTPHESWRELTDLAHHAYLHRAKNLNLFYTDALIV